MMAEEFRQRLAKKAKGMIIRVREADKDEGRERYLREILICQEELLTRGEL